MKIKTKLIAAFSILALLIAFVGLSNLYTNNYTRGLSLQRSKAIQLRLQLKDREIDHHKWVKKVQDIFIESQTALKVQTNDHKCALGKFLFGNAMKGIQELDKQTYELLEAVKVPHAALHQSAIEINGHLRDAGESIGNAKALRTFIQKTLPALKNVQAIFRQAVDRSMELDRRLKAEQDNLQNALASTTWATLLVSLILAIGVGSYVSININKNVKQFTRFVAKLSKGDLASRLAMGQAVNCSQIKQCDKPDCPSYGKEACCWVESGSFSNNPSCPRALKGEDCRSCNLYKKNVGDEFQEMGSALNGFIDELSTKAKVADLIASGDLTSQIHVASDEDILGIALSHMLENLKIMIREITTLSDQIASGSDQVASASQSLSQGATEQVSALDEISNAIAQVSSQARTNAENASEANQLSNNAKTTAGAGDTEISGMITAMGEIDESSQEISKIVKIIDDIAFQTNLLALNAAVEAARAGKSGKGFAVVAGEVRNLAQRSAKAASDIGELIDGTTTRISRGTGIASRAAEVFTEISESINKTTDLVADIAQASTEQAQGITQVNTGLEQIESVTQLNTANAEETAAAAEELSSQSAELRNSIGRFRV